ncbi:MAG: DUF4242 domain-containing protein [Alphaproteobacteria bacterium]|nr:DUF4242 domain-containing protein [Alphaproteobacteria bacterium]
MQAMKMFIDTHDAGKDTFPASISPADLRGFYEQYKAACAEEGVISLQLNVGAAAGRAFCVTLVPNAEAVARAHEKVGLAYDSITEVRTLTPNVFDVPLAPAGA